MSKPKRFTVKEAARLCRVAPNFIYQCVQDSRLQAKREGWTIYITQNELARFKANINDLLRPSARRHAPQPDSIGSRLRQLREIYTIRRQIRALTQAEIAHRFGVSQNTIKNLELNLRRISPEMILKYANFFHVTVDWILTGRN